MHEENDLKRRLLAIAVGVTTLVLAASGPALAILPGTLDQTQDNHADTSFQVNKDATNALAQTFTAAVTGNLVAVEIYVNVIQALQGVVGPNVVDGATVQIRTTSSNVPTATVLATASVVLVADQWNGIVFSTAAALTSGIKYALVVYPDVAQSLEWGGTCTAADYTGGSALILDGDWTSIPSLGEAEICIEHFAFRTYMSASTPPPTTAVASSSAPSDGTALPLLLAGTFGVLAFVTLRRIGLARH
jgi:hypothetical protein